MAVLFSVVTMKSGAVESRFIVGGIPRRKSDLQGWRAYEEFMNRLSEDQEIEVKSDRYVYGEGDMRNATVEEVAYLKQRMESQVDFLTKSCERYGHSRFVLRYEQGEYKDLEEHPKLIGSSIIRNKTLRSVEEVAEFICKDGLHGDVTVKYADGYPLLKTDGIYVTGITDLAYAIKLFEILLPMIKKVERGEEVKMNEWERERRRMERYKELYPPGTRIMLLSMDSDEKCPIEGGARGTVLNVSVGGIDVAWDNGRGSSLIPGKDSFRTLMESELAQEARLKNGKVADFGDDCKIVIPNEPIDCSKLGYFDELESDCWELVKGYLAKLGIELVANEDGEEPMSDYVAKSVQDKVIELLQESGVDFKFEQDETEEPVEDGGMKIV